MLSGETAIGEYPVEAVTMMNRIMTEVEQEFIGLTPKVTAYDPAANDWDEASSVLFWCSSHRQADGFQNGYASQSLVNNRVAQVKTT